MSIARSLFGRFITGAALVVALALGATAALAQTTFHNTSVILLPRAGSTGAPDNQSPGEPAGLYPSTITVSGMGSSISRLTVTIRDFRHAWPDDIDMLLVGPGGQKFMIWSDVGGLSSTCSENDDFQLLNCNNDTALGTTGPTITLDDAAASILHDNNALASGTFKPTNHGTATDTFPPATSPAPPYLNAGPAGTATFAGVFNGTNPNGTWRLYVIDDGLGGTGRINGGWSLTVTTAGVPLIPTTTTITGETPDPSNVNEPVIVSYTVTASSGTPAGNVTVSDGVSSCTGTVAQGQCTITLTTGGTRTLTATYAGSATHAGSSGPTSHVVRYNTTTTITGDTPDPSDVGQGVVVTWSVTSSGGPAPTGTVTVGEGFNTCQAAVGAGQCTLASLPAGDRTLTATYSGDSVSASSRSATTTHRVRYNTTTVITADTPDPSTPGQAVAVNYTVTSTGGPAPTGNVTVSDGVASCVASVAAGTCNVALATAGARTLVATYAGDSLNKGSASAGTPHQVTAAPKASTTTITGDTPDPSDMGQAVVVSYTVTGSGGTPAGNVTVTDGVDSCTATVAQGQCTITLNTPGNRTLTATFAGDASFATSNGTTTHRVRYNTTTTITNDTPDPSTNTQSVTVSYSVAATVAGGPAPTGNVTVSDGTSSCAGTAAAGSCALVVTTGGARTLVATYAGDSFNKSSVSAGASHTVTVPAPNLTIAKSHQGAFNVGQVGAAYTITVSNVGTGASGGMVTVTDALPAGLTATSMSGTGWSCTQPSGPCTRSDALGANASYASIMLLVNVALTAPPSVTNVASVAGGGDSDTSNNSVSDVTQISGGGTLYTLTITRNGSGAGTVTSQDGSIDCGAICTSVYLPGAVVTLNTSPAGGSTFNGWSQCVGTSSCVVTMNGNRAVTATFALSTNGTRVLDVDNNGSYDALTDALLITRYLFGLSATTLTRNAIGNNAQRSNPASVVLYLDDIRPRLDVDGNGEVDSLTDGAMVMRYMLGKRGASLTSGVLGGGATRTTQQIEQYLSTLMP